MEDLDETISDMLLHLQTDDPDTYKILLDKVKEMGIEVDEDNDDEKSA